MLDRYNIIEEAETAAALAQADAYLSTQPKARNIEVAHFRHSEQAVGGKALTVGEELAPQVGFEPTTLRLTAGCSTLELLRNSRLAAKAEYKSRAAGVSIGGGGTS